MMFYVSGLFMVSTGLCWFYWQVVGIRKIHKKITGNRTELAFA